MYSLSNQKSRNRASRRHQYVVYLVLAACFMVIQGTYAYGQIRLPRKGGIPVGKFMFYPSTVFDLGHTSNVLYSSDPIPSGIVVARVNLIMDMPLGPHHIRWSYSPQYKDYTTDRFVNDDPFSHFFDFEGRFQAGRSFSLGFTYRYVQGVTELQEVDPGNELVFGLTPFTLNEPRLDMEFRFGARQRLTVSPRYTKSRFADPVQAFNLDYETQAVDARYGFQVTRPSEFYFLYTREDTTQARTTLFFSEATLVTEAAGIGFRRSVNDNVVTSFSTAYTSVDVLGRDSDFAGLSFEAEGNWNLTDLMQVNVRGQRRPFQSFFLNNGFYVNNLLSARLIHQIGSRTYWQLFASYQINDYPEETAAPGDVWLPSLGVNRRDKTVGVELGVSYRFSSSMRAFIGYNYRQRESNMRQCEETNTIDNVCEGEVIAPFNFTDDRIILRLEAGWL